MGYIRQPASVYRAHTGMLLDISSPSAPLNDRPIYGMIMMRVCPKRSKKMPKVQSTGLLCGIDEAGRGPLAGPLIMAGVILPDEPIEGLGDSKKISAKRRERLYEEIASKALYHIEVIDHQQIDAIGISAALRLGLEAIQAALGEEVSYLFDGNSTFGASGIETMVRADAKVQAVGAASILAKVTRDRMMIAYAQHYPVYGFERHMGYGTRAHIEAIRVYGRCAIHRQSFRVKRLKEQPLFS
jgi:ribonuclease HII